MQVWIQMELIWVYIIQLYAYLKLQVYIQVVFFSSYTFIMC